MIVPYLCVCAFMFRVVDIGWEDSEQDFSNRSPYHHHLIYIYIYIYIKYKEQVKLNAP